VIILTFILPDKISEIIEGTSMLNDPWKLFAASVLLAIPSMMIYLSISLPPKINRLLNIGFGVFFALFLALILTSLDFEWYKFYMMFAAIEIVLAALIARKAYLWPQTES
jgi:NhaP-type Na+/H+ or K+/H+ antiporter